MKKLVLSVSVLASLGLLALTQQSCSVKDLAKELFNAFVTDPQTASFTIPIVTSTAAPFGALDSVILDANINQIIQDKTGGQFSLDDADGIFLESLRFELDNADADNNWQNFEQVGIELVPNNANVSNLSMGPWNVDNTYSTSLSLDNIDKSINIKSYLTGTGAVYYILKGKARKETSHPLTGTMYITFKVD